MAAARVLTVDPTWNLAQIVRSAIHLTDRPAVQVDVPGSLEALEEVKRASYSLLITTLHVDDAMKGIELALRVRQSAPQTAVIILADADDLEELDEETRADSPFIYMRRPVDIYRFMRVLLAALDEKDVFAAYNAEPAMVRTVDLSEMGSVPALDLKATQVVIDKLLTDVGAMAVVLSSRAGEVLVERGAVGYVDRERLTQALLPTVRSTIAMGDLVGGHPSALQFFDGDTYDVFVLSVGFHHFLSLVFDGEAGVRHFGAVTRFGRRASEDLKAMLGASAFTIEKVEPAADQRRKTGKHKVVEVVEAPVEPLLAKAETWDEPTPAPEEAALPILEPIENLDLSIFDKLDVLDETTAEELFNPEKLAQIASESRRGRGPISYDEARELGIVP